MVKAISLKEVYSEIKTGTGSSTMKPLQTCWHSLTGKYKRSYFEIKPGDCIVTNYLALLVIGLELWIAREKENSCTRWVNCRTDSALFCTINFFKY